MVTGYGADELSKVRMRILEVPLHEDVFSHFPDLAKIPHWDYDFEGWTAPEKGVTLGMVRTRIVRYINFFYSQELTCIRLRYSDFRQRKAECARLAGFGYDQQTLRFNSLVEQMLDGKHSPINRMIISFLKHNYNTQWSTLMVQMEAHYDMLKRVQDAIASGFESKKDKAPTTAEIEKSSDYIEKLQGKLLSGDDSKPISMALLKTMEEETLNYRPEEIVALLRIGKSPFGSWDYYNPYVN